MKIVCFFCLIISTLVASSNSKKYLYKKIIYPMKIKEIRKVTPVIYKELTKKKTFVVKKSKEI